MKPDNNIVTYQITEIQLNLKDAPGMRVSVIAGGSEITGQWIALTGGRESNLIVYDEKDGVVSETEIAIEMVAAVRTIEPADYSVNYHTRVAPTRQKITEMVVLIEAWTGSECPLMIGDIRQELKDGEREKFAPGYNDDMSADFLPEAEEEYLHGLLLKCVPYRTDARKRFESCGTQEIAEIIAEQFRTEALSHYLPKENEAAGKLSEEDWAKIYPHLQVAMSLKELRRVSHPFMKRRDLKKIAEHI